MDRKLKSTFAALCIAASFAGCSNESASADMNNSATAAARDETVLSNVLIGLDEAENAALAHAGVSAEEAKITKAELDRDNGNYEYEIEFTAKNYKYDYDISAADGSVLKFSKEAAASEIAETAAQTNGTAAIPETQNKVTETVKSETTASAATTAQTAQTAQTAAAPAPAEKTITAEDAKSAALKHAGLTASEVTFTKAKLDYDDGVAKYEIEFYSSSNEYEYDINAANGAVIKYSKEALELPAMKSENSMITLEDAKSAALEYAGLTAAEVKFTKAELDYDDGTAEYEIEFRQGRKEYEFKIDPYSGEILEAEID